MEVKKEMQRVVKEQSDVTKAKRNGGSSEDTSNDTSAEDVTEDNDLDLDEVFGDEE